MQGRLARAYEMCVSSGIFKDEAKEKDEIKIFEGQQKSIIC
jgi:hypothetical protein